MGADPIATATSIAAQLDGQDVHAFIIRKEPKGHGTGQWLEGRKTCLKAQGLSLSRMSQQRVVHR